MANWGWKKGKEEVPRQRPSVLFIFTKTAEAKTPLGAFVSDPEDLDLS